MKKILFIVCVCSFFVYTSEAWALSNADHERFLAQSEEFRNAEAELSQAWKDIMAGLPDKEKNAVRNEQRLWVKNGRDSSAQWYQNQNHQQVQAYAMATKAQAAYLRNFLKMHQNPQKELSLTGNVIFDRDAGGGIFALETPEKIQCNICYVWENEKSPVHTELSRLLDKQISISIKGKLTSFNAFDCDTVKLVK